MKLLIIINPISGNTNKKDFKKRAEKIFKKYNTEYKFFETSGKNDQEKIHEIAKDFQPDKIAAAGGDGTILTTTLAVKGLNIPVGIVPLGSANGMAFEINIPQEPIEALKDILLSSMIKKIDILVVNQEHYSLHFGDVGVNARVVQASEENENRGMASYAKAFLQEVGNFDKFNYTIETPDKKTEGKAVMTALCNARHFGSGIPINNVSNPFDGKFEIIVIKEVDASAIVNMGLAYFNENFTDNLNSELIQCTKAKLSFEKEHTLQLDGELKGDFKEIDIEILPAAVPIITTGSNRYL
jgi:diacylglycerol kinase family enzyme